MLGPGQRKPPKVEQPRWPSCAVVRKLRQFQIHFPSDPPHGHHENQRNLWQLPSIHALPRYGNNSEEPRASPEPYGKEADLQSSMHWKADRWCVGPHRASCFMQVNTRRHKATEGDAKEFGVTSTNPFKAFVEAWLNVLCESSLTLQEEAHTGCSHCAQLRFPNFIEPLHKDRQRPKIGERLSRVNLFLVSTFVCQIVLKRRLYCTASETRGRNN